MKALSAILFILPLTLMAWALMQFRYQYMWVQEPHRSWPEIIRIHRLTGSVEAYDKVDKAWQSYAP